MKPAPRCLAAAAFGWGAASAWMARPDGPATVVFDGACPVCRATVRTLRRWDTAGRLRYLDGRDAAAVRDRFPTLPPDPDLREMRLVFRDGTVLGGFDAARVLAAMLPALLPLAPFLFLPGIRPVGAAVYRFIAANRPRSLACTEHTCGLPDR